MNRIKLRNFIYEMNSYNEFIPIEGVAGLVKQFKTFNDQLIDKLSEIKNEIDVNILIEEIIERVKTINNSYNKWSSNKPKTYLIVLKWIIDNLSSEINITEKLIDILIEESYKIGSETIATFIKNRPELIYMYENKLVKNKMSVKMVDVLLDDKLSNNERANNTTIIIDALLNNKGYNYSDYKTIEYMLDKIEHPFSKEDIRKLVYNNQHSTIEYLIKNKRNIDFGPYSDRDVKTITSNGFWRYYIFYNKFIEDVEYVMKLAIRTSYLNAQDVVSCIKKKYIINWNAIILDIIERRTDRQYMFFKEIMKKKLIVQDVNLTKHAIMKYKSKIARVLSKTGCNPKLTTDEFDTWVIGTQGRLQKSVSILELIIKYDMYPLENIISRLAIIDHKIKHLKNPLQASVWKILKKHKIITDQSLVIESYLKLNQKYISKSLFEYLYTSSLKCKYDWLSLFKIAGRNGNDYFMNLIVDVDRNYYELKEFKYDISEFCKKCSVETMEKFTEYQVEISKEQEIIKNEKMRNCNINSKIENLEKELKRLKIKKGELK